MKVLVIYGGNSSERDISLLSGVNIGEALTAAGHTVRFYDPSTGISSLSKNLRGIDVAFPILHGKGGEDGMIQQALELEAAAYVGSNATVSATCFDKWQTIQKASNILFPKTELVSWQSVTESSLIKQPFVVKPRAEGSSIDTFIVHDPSDFDIAKLQPIFERYNNELLLEECIVGQEVTVGVLDTQPLPVVEIIPPVGQEFDYSNKYNGATAENCPPKIIAKSLQERAQAIALELHTIMGCRHFSRTDMIIDKAGKIFVLEINTLPGMTKESLFPRAAAAAGLPTNKLVDKLVALAIE